MYKILIKWQSKEKKTAFKSLQPDQKSSCKSFILQGIFLKVISNCKCVTFYVSVWADDYGGTKGARKGVRLTAALWLKTPNYGNEQRRNYIP